MKTKQIVVTGIAALLVFAGNSYADSNAGCNFKQGPSNFRSHEGHGNGDFGQGFRQMNSEDHSQGWFNRRGKQSQDSRNFRDYRDQKREERWEKKINKYQQLPDSVKQDIWQFREKQQQENGDFRKARRDEMRNSIDKILADSNLTPEQKRKAIDEQKKSNWDLIRQHRETQRAENQSKWKEIQESLKNQAQTLAAGVV